jgi:HlyD family secretion protein
VVIGIVVLVLLGGGAAAYAATRSTDPSYRTTTAGPAKVTSVLTGTGTVQPVSEATVSFPVSGQVAAVSVKQGDTVTSGQVLAQLNTTTLAGQVSTAQSSLATAQAKLAADQTSQTTSVPTPSTPSSGSGNGSSAKLTQLLKSISTGQNAVRGAQQKVDGDLKLAGAALKHAQTTCPDIIKQLGATGSNPPSTTDPTPTSTTAPPPAAPPASVTDCTDLLQQVQDAQAKTAADETALSQTEAALSTTLGQAATAVQQSASSSSSAATKPTSGSTGGSQSGSRGGSSTPPSADQIAADQAQVDAANAQLAANQQNLAAANLVSPIDGTVAQVDVVSGQNAAANSSTAKIVIIGAGGNQVTTAVNDNQVGQVKPGQPATITPDGAAKPLTGKVVAIGALSSTTTGGSASFPVTISVDGGGPALFAGSTAGVAITLGTAQAAVTVPTSAVHTAGAASFVTTLVNGTTTSKRVTVGVIGATVTQITQGLNAGDEVVLADLSQALPSATTGAGTRGLTGGGGGFRPGGTGGGGGGATTGGQGGR